MSHPLRDILLKLTARENLSREQARLAFEHIMSGNAHDAQIGAFLFGLQAKGFCADEIIGAASVMREKSLSIPVDDATNIIDTCGTGGTVKGTFNISTCAALVVAGAGVCVVKHGNRAASSKTGSADVLEKLGVKLEVPVETLQKCLRDAKICFAFARSHHPAMKHVAPTRTHLAIPTIFNVLGPLTNPAKAKFQLLGVMKPHLTDLIAQALKELGSVRAWVVHSDDGMDELSTMFPTRITELRNGTIETWTLKPAELKIPPAKLSDLQVNNADESAEVIKNVLNGGKGPQRDIVALNAAAALVICGKVNDLKSGLTKARGALDSGAARDALKALVAASQG